MFRPLAAGNDNATLAAARRCARVTSTDYVPALLDRGRERPRAQGQSVQFQVADAEALPFDDGSFDVVLSTCSSSAMVSRSSACLPAGSFRPEAELFDAHDHTVGRRDTVHRRRAGLAAGIRRSRFPSTCAS